MADSYVYRDGQWHHNSIYCAIREGWSRTRIARAAIEAGEEVDIPETVKQVKDDPMVILVLLSGEVFRGGYRDGHMRFSRFNPLEYACIDILPGLQL